MYSLDRLDGILDSILEQREHPICLENPPRIFVQENESKLPCYFIINLETGEMKTKYRN